MANNANPYPEITEGMKYRRDGKEWMVLRKAAPGAVALTDVPFRGYIVVEVTGANVYGLMSSIATSDLQRALFPNHERQMKR